MRWSQSQIPSYFKGPHLDEMKPDVADDHMLFILLSAALAGAILFFILLDPLGFGKKKETKSIVKKVIDPNQKFKK